ncbi:hypothetical protein O3P69_017760 [Scylla paramamosain]|uniref:Uncharacterized protein n=1 Tax=Scylla paramamosain TaxID=85552 RepID=A0AAW0SEX0_SCYPA
MTQSRTESPAAPPSQLSLSQRQSSSPLTTTSPSPAPPSPSSTPPPPLQHETAALNPPRNVLPQGRLDQLQAEVSKLEQRSEQLEARVKSFFRQHHALAAATDQIDLKLEALNRQHKTLSSS